MSRTQTILRLIISGMAVLLLPVPQTIAGHGGNLEPFIPEIGGTFCSYLARQQQIHRKYLRQCPDPTCGWDSWQDAQNMRSISSSELQQSSTVTAVTATTNALSTASIATLSKTVVVPRSKRKDRIVLSYAHNGFGNQIWQHTVAFMIAESLHARLYIASIPESLSPDGISPPNTWAGMNAMQKLLPKQFLFDQLPADSPDRKICDAEKFFISDRPRDWRGKNNYTSHFKNNLYELLHDTNTRCLKTLGYFQNYAICRDDVKKLWTPKLLTNYTMSPGDNDLSIYLRCVPRHYYFNERRFYEAILNHTRFDRIWLFTAPECPSRLGNNPARDGAVASVMRYLIEQHNATKYVTLSRQILSLLFSSSITID